MLEFCSGYLELRTLNRTSRTHKQFFHTLKLQGRRCEKFFKSSGSFYCVPNSHRAILSKILIKNCVTDTFKVSINFFISLLRIQFRFFFYFFRQNYFWNVSRTLKLVERNRICYSELFGLDIYFFISFIFFPLNQKSFFYIENCITR